MKLEASTNTTFRCTAIAAELFLVFGSAHSQESNPGYGEQLTSVPNTVRPTDTVYRAPEYQARAATVHTPTSIQGCDAGLIIVSGSYKCKSLALVSEGGLVPDPEPIVVTVNGHGYTASEAHAWGLPGFTGGYDAGYDAMGRTDALSEGSAGPGTSTGGGGGGGRVICTHFYKKGEIDRDVWKADLKFTRENLSDTTVRSYHYWAVPYVQLMRRNELAEKIMRPIAKWRAQELAFQMGVVEKGSFKGKLVRLVLEPVCFAIGCVVGQKEYNHLWTDADRAQFAAI